MASRNPENRPPKADRRLDARWPRQEPAFVQVVRAYGGSSAQDQVVATRTINLSREGIRLLVNAELETGMLLDVCVDLHGNRQRFLLTGEVRWCESHPGGEGYEIGIEIQPGEGTDFLVWSETVSVLKEHD